MQIFYKKFSFGLNGHQLITLMLSLIKFQCNLDFRFSAGELIGEEKDTLIWREIRGTCATSQRWLQYPYKND